MPVSPIGGQERTKVELVDDIEHEPGQMVGWQPIAHIGWEQERLVAVAGKEVVGHGRSYAVSLLCCLFQRSGRWEPELLAWGREHPASQAPATHRQPPALTGRERQGPCDRAGVGDLSKQPHRSGPEQQVPPSVQGAGKDQLIGQVAALGVPGIVQMGSGRHRQRVDRPVVTQAMAPQLIVPARHKRLLPRHGQVFRPARMHVGQDAIAPRGKAKVDAAALGDCPADRWATLDPQRQPNHVPIGTPDRLTAIHEHPNARRSTIEHLATSISHSSWLAVTGSSLPRPGETAHRYAPSAVNTPTLLWGPAPATLASCLPVPSRRTTWPPRDTATSDRSSATATKPSRPAGSPKRQIGVS
jgi:hypothetical protein